MTTDPQTPVEELEGRELDAAVAQEIFHIGHGPTPAHSWERLDPGDAQHLQSSYRCDRCGELSGWQSIDEIEKDGPCEPNPAHYSSSVGAAWRVVEAVWADADFNLEWHRGTWVAGEYDRHEGVFVYGGEADTAPLAICRAALKAVRDE